MGVTYRYVSRPSKESSCLSPTVGPRACARGVRLVAGYRPGRWGKADGKRSFQGLRRRLKYGAVTPAIKANSFGKEHWLSSTKFDC